MALFSILSTCRGGGYLYARTFPRHPRANSKGLYPLHRVLAENTLGRLLQPDEDAHHKDGDKWNNAPDNIEVLTHTQHAQLHGLARVLPNVRLTCPCGKEFELPNHRAALRARRKSGPLTCSRGCGNRFAKRLRRG